MFHHFQKSVSDIALPERFTYPFCYTPHPLSLMAAEEVQHYLHSKKEWEKELAEGKMFGVLVVRNREGEVGYLAAFSGLLAGSNNHEFFVPPVYDLTRPDGFFKAEEHEISAINHHIQMLEESPEYQVLKTNLATLQEESALRLSEGRKALKRHKKERDALRKAGGLTPEDEERLIRESQFQKAEFHREELQWRQRIAAAEVQLKASETEIEALKNERKERSAQLQQRLFEQFRLLNYRGEVRDLCTIFRESEGRIPPAGAGECAAPKLLQYAFIHDMKPLAMAEFWWGASPKTEIRHHGHFYPSCKGKCRPILGHMLQGLDVEENPMTKKSETDDLRLETLYDDEWLAVVNKPHGMLSVPGKMQTLSVYDIVRRRYPDAEEPMIVHRLDMATSGLLVIAKTKEVHRLLQAQFKNRTVEKRYAAILDGNITPDSGEIRLPLCPDPDNRPRQMVHHTYGKPAVTTFEVVGRKDGRTWVRLRPVTGRTHQLRVHMAHPDGLGTPIVGDELYGLKHRRLYLHAEYLSFVHPVTGERITIEKRAGDFAL